MIASLAKWLVLSLAGLSLTILTVLLSPLLALTISTEGYLPAWLSWFQTPDAPAIGDKGFQETQMSWTTNKYIYALFWLCRNPAYGFDYNILSFSVLKGFNLKSFGNPKVSNSPLVEGWCFRKLVQGTKTYFQFYYVKTWSANYCIRLNFGWKLWGDIHSGQLKPLVCSPMVTAKYTL
jgi:hypothetical protein